MAEKEIPTVDAATGGTAEPAPASLGARLSRAEAELELLREGLRRLEAERRRLERELTESESARASVEARLGERERYLKAIHGSSGWKLLQRLRGLVGRRW